MPRRDGLLSVCLRGRTALVGGEVLTIGGDDGRGERRADRVAAGLCTNTPAAGAVLLGVAVAVAANPSGAGIVRLNGAAPAAVFA